MTGGNATSSVLVAAMHHLIHVQRNFMHLARSATEGAGLVPQSHAYLSVLVFFAGVFGALCVASVVCIGAASLYQCVRCARSKKAGRRGESSVAIALIFATLVFIMSGTCLFVTFALHHGFSRTSTAADSGLALFVTAAGNVSAGAGAASNGASAGQQLYYAIDNDPQAPQSTVAAVQRVTSTLQNLATDFSGLRSRLPQLTKVQHIKRDVDVYASSYVFPALYVVAVLCLVGSVVLGVAAVCQRPFALVFAVVVGTVVVVLAWLCTGVYFDAALLSADVCAQPSQYIAAQIHETPDSPYFTCTYPVDSPFADSLAAINASVTSLHAPNNMHVVTLYCEGVQQADVQADCLALQRGVADATIAKENVAATLYCPAPHAAYADIVGYICAREGVAVQLIYGLAAYAVLAVAVTMTVLFYTFLAAGVLQAPSAGAAGSERRGTPTMAMRRLPRAFVTRSVAEDADDASDDALLIPSAAGSVPWGAHPLDHVYRAPSPAVVAFSTNDAYTDSVQDPLVPDFFAGNSLNNRFTEHGGDGEPSWARQYSAANDARFP